MSSYKFQVITKVPKHDGPHAAGNLAATFFLYQDRNDGSVPQQIPTAFLSFRTPVFTLGEIVIVDSDGREVAGLQRKASKWSVEYEMFDTVEDAVSRAAEIDKATI
jgi:hypothetical protein